MLKLNSISTVAVSTLFLALSTMPVPATADSTGFRTAKQLSQTDRSTKARSSKADLYKVRDHRNKRLKRHKRDRHHRHKRHHLHKRHHRHNRRQNGLFLFNSPYDPFFGTLWGYPPNYYNYERRPRSGITFYFHN